MSVARPLWSLHVAIAGADVSWFDAGQGAELLQRAKIVPGVESYTCAGPLLEPNSPPLLNSRGPNTSRLEAPPC